MKRLLIGLGLLIGSGGAVLGVQLNHAAEGREAGDGPASDTREHDQAPDQGGAQQVEGQAADQERVQALLSEVVPVLETDPGFAGVWVDPESDWSIEVATTSPVATVSSQLSPFEGRGTPFHIHSVTYTKRELSELQYEIAAGMEQWRAQGINIVTVSFNAKLNRVRVRVESADEATVAALIRSYGDRIAIEEAPPFESSACISRSNCASPIKGGLALAPACTSGFVTRDIAWAGAAYMMLAGHCIQNNGGLGVPWFHNSSVFGTANSEQFGAGSSTDSGYILLSSGASPGNQVFVSTSDIRSMTGFIPNVSQTIGTWVCKSGKTTNYTCGQIVDDDASVPVSGVLLHHQWIAGYSSTFGDSGGPVMFANNGHGIHHASNGAGLSVYSTMDWIRLTTGKTMRVTAAC